jgi:hypothetical protein
MRNNFTPLLLIPVFIFACSKHQSHPTTPTPVDSTNANVYLDPGTVNAIVATDTFRSFNLIHAYDTNGFVNITAKALINNDTCGFSIGFPDTLHTNTPVTNIFSLGFFDDFLGTVYLSGVNNNFTGDTLVITTFDKSKHLLAGTFKATMTASTQESPSITQTAPYVTGSFNTYYNTAK